MPAHTIFVSFGDVARHETYPAADKRGEIDFGPTSIEELAAPDQPIVLDIGEKRASASWRLAGGGRVAAAIVWGRNLVGHIDQAGLIQLSADVKARPGVAWYEEFRLAWVIEDAD